MSIMRLCRGILFIAGLMSAQSQDTPKQVSDIVVIATVDNRHVVVGEIRAILSQLPPAGLQMYEVNPEVALQQYFVVKYLADEAERKGLDKQSHDEGQPEFTHLLSLATLALNDYSSHLVIPRTEQQKYYEGHTLRYTKAKVRVIYVAFTTADVKSIAKPRTRSEAFTEIEKLRKRLSDGADFAVLAAEASDDKQSAAKGGEWGILTRASQLPEDVTEAIFALKPGEVSRPVKQSNGYYLYKVDEFSRQPYEEVADKVSEQMTQEQTAAYVASLHQRFTVKVANRDLLPHVQPTAFGGR